MDERKLHEKLDKIVDNVGEIKVTQAIHTEQLKEHMRRTDLLEKKQDRHEENTKEEFERIEEEIKPVTEHVHNLKGIKKLLLTLTAIVGLLAALGKLL